MCSRVVEKNNKQEPHTGSRTGRGLRGNQSEKTMTAKPKSKPKKSPSKPLKTSTIVCGSCKKTPDFCRCTAERQAQELLQQRLVANRAKVLLEVADWIAGKSREAVKPKRAARLAMMAEAVAQDRML